MKQAAKILLIMAIVPLVFVMAACSPKDKPYIKSKSVDYRIGEANISVTVCNPTSATYDVILYSTLDFQIAVGSSIKDTRYNYTTVTVSPKGTETVVVNMKFNDTACKMKYSVVVSSYTIKTT